MLTNLIDKELVFQHETNNKQNTHTNYNYLGEYIILIRHRSEWKAISCNHIRQPVPKRNQHTSNLITLSNFVAFKVNCVNKQTTEHSSWFGGLLFASFVFFVFRNGQIIFVYVTGEISRANVEQDRRRPLLKQFRFNFQYRKTTEIHLNLFQWEFILTKLVKSLEMGRVALFGSAPVAFKPAYVSSSFVFSPSRKFWVSWLRGIVK